MSATYIPHSIIILALLVCSLYHNHNKSVALENNPIVVLTLENFHLNKISFIIIFLSKIVIALLVCNSFKICCVFI